MDRELESGFTEHCNGYNVFWVFHRYHSYDLKFYWRVKDAENAARKCHAVLCREVLIITKDLLRKMLIQISSAENHREEKGWVSGSFGSLWRRTW